MAKAELLKRLGVDSLVLVDLKQSRERLGHVV
jgi:hypothetical protein